MPESPLILERLLAIAVHFARFPFQFRTAVLFLLKLYSSHSVTRTHFK